MFLKNNENKVFNTVVYDILFRKMYTWRGRGYLRVSFVSLFVFCFAIFPRYIQFYLEYTDRVRAHDSHPRKLLAVGKQPKRPRSSKRSKENKPHIQIHASLLYTLGPCTPSFLRSPVWYCASLPAVYYSVSAIANLKQLSDNFLEKYVYLHSP